ncbi:MAG: SAM-dependent methyltransferase, partial [Patescibacteria group bacterium]
KLISFIRQELPAAEIIPIPGSSALTAVLSVSGIRADQFTFLGYPPHKKGRQTFFKVLKEIETRPIIFYESPHRVEKTLKMLREFFGPSYEIIVGRELTKVHEEIWQGSLAEAENHFQAENKKGEFVIIIP